MNLRFFILACLALLCLRITVPSTNTVLAKPHAQATRTPTEEPTKRPYVFPTPIYIPPFADDTPAPRVTPVATLPPGTETYTVQAGDSPWTIAQKVYGDGTKYKLIMEANGLTDQTRLRVGTVLKIPSLGNPSAQSTPAPAAPTSAVIAPTPATTPTALPTAPVFPTLAPTPVPGAISGSMVDTVANLITIVSGILVIGALVVGGLAYLAFRRARRIEQLESGKQPLRLKR